jgi:hypothetical protein
MDPYIEERHDWSAFHAEFIVDIARRIRRALPKGFIARVEQSLAVEGPDTAIFATARNVPDSRQPDVTIFETERTAGVATLTTKVAPLTRPLTEPQIVTQGELQQRFVRIYDRRHGNREVVAIVELLSPTNKDGAEGTAQYKRKQREARESGIHLLEIDLLRYGNHVVYVPKAILEDSGPYDYLVTLAHADHPLEYRFWRIGLRDTLPALAIPLTPDVAPVPLDLQAVFDTCYDEAGLGDAVEYTREPDPPLPPDDAAWANDRLVSAGLR